MKLHDMTVGDLLERFPNGFSVGPSGKSLDRFIAASSYLSKIAKAFPLPPTNGGYLVVEMVEEEELKRLGIEME